MAAPINGDYLALTALKGELEYDMMIIDAEIQTITIKAGYMYQEYAEMLEEEAIASGLAADAEIDTTEEFNWEIFKHEYDVAQTKLDNQEKQLEMQKTNKQTKLTEVTNLLESEQKRLEKSIENGWKGIES